MRDGVHDLRSVLDDGGLLAQLGRCLMATLTKREIQCLVRVAEGMGNREIGKDLYLSEDTVKSHLCRVYKKLGAKDRANAVWLGIQAGFLEPKLPGRWSWSARPGGSS